MKKDVMLGLLVAAAEPLVTLKSVKDLNGADIMGIRRTVKPLLIEIEEYHTLRNEKITELGTVDEKGVATLKVDNPNYKVFQKWVADVTNSIITIKIKHQVNLDEITRLKPCPLSDNDIDILVELGILLETPEPEDKDETVKSLRETLSVFSPKSDVEETPVTVDQPEEVVAVEDATTELPKIDDSMEDGEITEVPVEEGNSEV